MLKLTDIVLALTLLGAIPALSANEPESVNFKEIHQQAIFANAAYQPEGTVRELVEAGNYSLTLYRTIPDIQISFFLATNELTKTQIISVRGTSNIENAMVDISLKLRVDENTGVRLHEGFSLAAKQVYKELKPLLKPDYKISVTGHSLGGAVALILGMYLDANQFDIEQVITFGQPKVTNISGANKLQHINVIRVVTPFDLVPLVPPIDPLDLSNLDVYWHAGKEVILLTETQYAILQGTDSMLRATKFTQKPLTKDNLNNHQMPLYLESIKAKTRSSKLVPYKTDFNLFNLFGSE
ncbi:MAG: lipase family protein [Gammaproteobacteria bacterium]|nr:lipase family protein [Gammaproteobacteria bacterium]